MLFSSSPIFPNVSSILNQRVLKITSGCEDKDYFQLMRDWFEKNLDMLIQKQDQAVEAVKLEYLLQRKVITTSSRYKNLNSVVNVK